MVLNGTTNRHAGQLNWVPRSHIRIKQTDRDKGKNAKKNNCKGNTELYLKYKYYKITIKYIIM